MLVDFVLRTTEQTAEEIVNALVDAGIEGVVYDSSDSTLSTAVEKSALAGYAASVYREDGAALFALGSQPIDAASDDLEAWQNALTSFDGAVIASHPYDRTQGRPWGDRIYRLKGVTHVATTSGALERSRDKLAVAVANKKALGCVSGSMGDKSALGKIATFIDQDTDTLSGLLAALEEKRTLNCQLESAEQPYVPMEEPRERPGFRSDRDRERGRDRGRQGRGPRRR